MKKILEINSGSTLYGLDTPESDLDIFGIYLESPEDILQDYLTNSNHKGRELDLSEVIKLNNGKNSKESIDKKYFSLKKYVARAINGNPNILEIMYADDNNIRFKSELGQQLIDMRHDFLSQKVFYTFGSYANSQAKKMRIKKKTFDAIELAEGYLNKLENHVFLFDYEKDVEFKRIFEPTQHHYKIIHTDYKIPKTVIVKTAKKEMAKIIGNSSNRKELVKAKSFDTKFGSHTLRLLYECEQILLDEEITFPIKGRDTVMNMKVGNISIEDSEELINAKWKDVERAFKITKLPKVANYDKIMSWSKVVLYENFNNNGGLR